MAHARAGRRGDAEHVLETLLERAAKESVPPEALVLCFAVLDRLDDAFRWLQRSIDDRSVSFFLFDLRLEPAYEGLRSDPRLGRMFREIGLQLGDPPAGS